MGELLVEEKQVVVPGEILAKGMDYFPNIGTYRKDENIIASD
jgi:exosome complex RNA-binding protein Rrp4